MSDEDLDGFHVGKSRRGRWLAGAAGVSAVGAVAGATVAGSMLNRRAVIDDPFADEDFETLDGDRSYLVTTPDGVPLAVREVGPTDAPLTVVFAHGFCLRMGAFHFQRMRLCDEWGTQVRMIFYDQRGHGRSGKAPPETYTLTQLGKDLETVLQVISPRGPIVLVGHSMGGMTVLSHARQFPRHYGGRIAGAALISSAAEGVAESPLGEILNNPALEAVLRAARSAPKLVQRGRTAARSLIGPILRAASFSDMRVSPSIVAFSEKMMLETPIPTMVEFLHALQVHDETAALRHAGQDPDADRLRRPRSGHPRRILEENGRGAAGIGVGDRREGGPSGVAGKAGFGQRRVGATGQARDPGQIHGAESALARSGPAS